MPTAIVETSGAANANSFASIAEIDAILDDRLNASAWTAESDADQKIRAAIEATRELTRLRYVGQRTDSTQALSWPRTYAPNPDHPEADDGLATIAYYGTTEIPQRIKNAQAELALEFLRAGTTDIAGRDTDREIIRKKIDVIETEWASPQGRPDGLNRYPRVLQEIVPLLSKASGGLNFVRV